MGTFTLQPAKLFQTRLIVDKSKPIETYTFRELVALLAPQNEPTQRARLGSLKPGYFVGTSHSARNPKKINTFFLATFGPGDLAHALQKDPSFVDRMISVYRVETTGYDAKVDEPKKLPRDPEIPPEP